MNIVHSPIRSFTEQRRSASDVKFCSIEQVLEAAAPLQPPFSVCKHVLPRLREDVVRQLLAVLCCVLARYDDSYPFIDTKFNPGTGEDFNREDAVRGQSVIYCWIQGRGLEAIASHGQWLQHEESVGDELREDLLIRIRRLLSSVTSSMEQIRAANGGFMPFMADRSGQQLHVAPNMEVVPLKSGAKAQARSLSDLFYAKGLLAAAHYLDDDCLRSTSEQIFLETVNDLRSGCFVSGQVAFDPKNPVHLVAGRHSHTGRMIALGAATLFYNITKKREYAQIGHEFINHILEYHTLTGANVRFLSKFAPQLQRGDMWEFNDAKGLPWVTETDQIWSDSGHATEFAGLALAHIDATGSRGSTGTVEQLSEVLFRNVENGFSGLGIVKAFDLVGRKPINSDMPWWSCPRQCVRQLLFPSFRWPEVSATFWQRSFLPEAGMRLMMGMCAHRMGLLPCSACKVTVFRL